MASVEIRSPKSPKLTKLKKRFKTQVAVLGAPASLPAITLDERFLAGKDAGAPRQATAAMFLHWDWFAFGFRGAGLRFEEALASSSEPLPILREPKCAFN